MRRAILLPLVLLTPTVAFAASPRTFLDLANTIVTVLNSGIGVLLAAGIAIYFMGISTNFFKLGEGDKEKMRAYFFWGIVILFVMVSIWGIIRLLQSSLFGNSSAYNTQVQPTQQQAQFQAPQYAE